MYSRDAAVGFLPLEVICFLFAAEEMHYFASQNCMVALLLLKKLSNYRSCTKKNVLAVLRPSM